VGIGSPTETLGAGLSVLILAAVACGIGLAACESLPPPPPDEFSWEAYVNAAVGYEMEIPDAYRPDEEDDGKAVFFRWRGTVPVKVYLADEEMGRDRGLWPGHEPVGEIELGGRPGALYEYTHCDGPFCSKMKSFVVEHMGRSLGLEFRTEGDLDEMNRHIVDSFSFLGAAGGEAASSGG
jgi:hypothetical protein